MQKESLMNYYEDEAVSLFLKDMEQIEAYKSHRQTIQLLKHPWLGKVLIINREIQHIEKYQALYHEILVHLPSAFIPFLKTALIIGGGSLFAAYEVLKYPTVDSVVLCDYDHTVLDLMSTYYPHARAVLQDRRFHYIEQDGRDFIRKHKGKYDLIVNDCFNLAFESNQDNTSYFTLLSNLSSESGVCVDIIYRHIFDKQVTIDTLTYLNKEKRLALALVTVPEYPGILHIETIWGNSSYISQSIQHTVNQYQHKISTGDADSPFQYFSPNNIPFYLYLPPYIKNMFNL